jgi:biopolymer transport protein TolQ
VWAYVSTASWFGLAILGLLIFMSALSWAIIVMKALQLRQVTAENEYFLSALAKDQAMAGLYTVAQKLDSSPLARLYEHGYREISNFRQRVEKAPVPDARERLMDALARTLERIFNQQTQVLEHRLPLLATVSGTAPYVGLFGTVLGIIVAFRDIGVSGVTSLAVVAPGISEALISTAAGLATAIPALIAYNSFRNRVRDASATMKNFALDITNRMERLL